MIPAQTAVQSLQANELHGLVHKMEVELAELRRVDQVQVMEGQQLQQLEGSLFTECGKLETTLQV